MSEVKCIDGAIVLTGSNKCFKAKVFLNEIFNYYIIQIETLLSK